MGRRTAGSSRNGNGLGGLRRSERRWGILLALPAVAGFAIFTLGPMVAAFFIGLTKWSIGGTPKFVGLANYEQILQHDDLFYKSLSVTLYYSLVGVPILLVVAFVAAMLLNQKVRGMGIYRTVFYLPVLVPFVASSLLWLWIFNPNHGLANTVLGALGLPGSQWTFGSESVIPSLIIVNVWAFGNAAIIFLAGLQGVPQQLYEAVSIDGGNAWHRLRHVTIPMVTPTILYNLVTGFIITFQEFARPYIMTKGGPGNESLLYVFYVWRTAFEEGRMGYASALSWFLFIVIGIVTVIVFRSARSWVYYEGGEGR